MALDQPESRIFKFLEEISLTLQASAILVLATMSHAIFHQENNLAIYSTSPTYTNDDIYAQEPSGGYYIVVMLLLQVKIAWSLHGNHRVTGNFKVFI